MGLQGIELVMEVEDRFGIKVSNAEASSMYSMGDLLNLVLVKLGRPVVRGTAADDYDTCLRRLTSALSETVPGFDHPIRPETRMDALLPPKRRRATWKRLERAVGLRLPVLDASPFQDRLVATTWNCLPVVCFAGLPLGILVSRWWLALYGGVSSRCSCFPGCLKGCSGASALCFSRVARLSSPQPGPSPP